MLSAADWPRSTRVLLGKYGLVNIVGARHAQVLPCSPCTKGLLVPPSRVHAGFARLESFHTYWQWQALRPCTAGMDPRCVLA